MPFYNFKEIENKNKIRILVIGQVQSGKTTWIENRIMCAINQKFDFCIVYGGTTNLLTNQTITRFEKSEFIEEGCGKLPKIVNIGDVKNDIPANYCKKTNNYFPIFVILKGKDSLESINFFLENVLLTDKRILIIDDESDFASTNTNKNSCSKIYSCIEEIFKKTTRSEFVQITATPFANIVSQKFDQIVLLSPPPKYTGSRYFLENKKYKILNAKKNNTISCNESIEESLSTWLVLTAKYLLETKNDNKSEFLINIDLKKPKHKEIKDQIKDFICFYQRYPDNTKPFKKAILSYAKKITEFQIIEKIKDIVSYLIANDCILILNSDDNSIYKSGMYKFSILIGGTKISRGFTFEYLLTELLLNAPNEKAAIDTLLQRARWFGYRHKYDDMQKYMLIFMNKNIYDLYKAADKTISFLEENYKSDNLREKLNSFYKKYIQSMDIKLTNKKMGNM